MIVAFTALGLGGTAITWADEKSPEPSNEAKQGIEIRRKFAELSRKVNEQPELKALKADVEKAQRAYSEAFEQALAKEDPEILAKYRRLFEGRIERLQGKKTSSVQPQPVAGELGEKGDEQKRIAQAQKQAMLAPSVRETLQKWSAAASDSERESAQAAYAEALRKAMIEADPSLKGALLESVAVPMPSPEATPAK
jgi:hypothetical protein